MLKRVLLPVVLLLCGAGPAWAADDPPRDAVRAAVGLRSATPRCRLTRAACGTARACPRPYWYECYFRPRSAADHASLLAAAGFAAGSGLVLAVGDRKTIHTASDAGQWVAPALGLAVPLAHRDLRSVAQFGLGLALTGGLVFAGKDAIHKQRPPLTGPNSYPSGHTAPAFAAAAFLHERYGARYGIPAYVVAIHTGVARVVGNKHFLDDVIAGAGIGMLSAGLLEELFSGRCKPCTSWRRRPTWRYEFGFGAFWQTENRVRAPATGGTPIDLATLGDWTDPRASARLTVEWFPNATDAVAFRIDPADVRTRAVTAGPVSFGGRSFPAGAPVIARWRGNEYRIRWRRDLLPCHRCLDLEAGAALVFVENGVSFESGTARGSVTSLRVAPCPHVALAYELRPRLTLSAQVEGVPGVSFFGLDLEAAVRYRITPRWDAGVAYRWWWRPLDDSRLADDAATQALFVTIGRSF